MHGSTVTYSVVPESGYVVRAGVSAAFARISSMASSSACRVAYAWGPSATRVEVGSERAYITQFVGPVTCTSDDSSIPYENAAHGHFRSRQSLFCLTQWLSLAALARDSAITMFIASFIQRRCSLSAPASTMDGAGNSDMRPASPSHRLRAIQEMPGVRDRTIYYCNRVRAQSYWMCPPKLTKRIASPLSQAAGRGN